MSTDQLPPVGSLWLRRETGERRFVYVGVSPHNNLVYFAQAGRWTPPPIYLPDWLAWQAGAVRIDRGEA